MFVLRSFAGLEAHHTPPWVRIKTGMEYLEPAYKLIKETFDRSKLPFMDYKSLQRYMEGLGDYGKLVVAEYQGNLCPYHGLIIIRVLQSTFGHFLC